METKEEFFLLTENQQKILKEVTDHVYDLTNSLFSISEFRLNTPSPSNCFDIPDNLSVPQFRFNEMVVKLLIIQEIWRTSIEQVKCGQTALQKIMHTYPKWIKLRNDCINRMREIDNFMEILKKKCLMQKVTGTTVGGSLFLIGSLLAHRNLASLMSLAGLATTVVGFNNIFAETQILDKIKEAQAVLDEDKKYFKELYNLKEHAAKLENALSEFLQIDIVQDMFESVKDFVIKLMEIENDDRRINYIKEELKKLVIRSHLSRKKTQAVPIIVIPVFISFLVSIILLMLKRENQIIFAFVPQFLRNMSPFIPDSIIMSAKYLHAADASLMSMDIQKDSYSLKQIKISEAVKKLEEEAENFEKFCENMSKTMLK